MTDPTPISSARSSRRRAAEQTGTLQAATAGDSGGDVLAAMRSRLMRAIAVDEIAPRDLAALVSRLLDTEPTRPELVEARRLVAKAVDSDLTPPAALAALMRRLGQLDRMVRTIDADVGGKDDLIGQATGTADEPFDGTGV